MGGGQKRGRTQRRHFRQNRENVWKKNRSDNPSSSENSAWEPFATQNPAFDEYYKEQGIVSEEEWGVFMEVLRKPLPAAFRINSSGQFFQDIRSQLENDFTKSLEITDGDEAEAIRPLPWYPNNLAWHLNFSRMQLRKNQTLERFHEFLKQENEIGNITRQEAVSMVPPLFLDVCPDHFVLDMCAAPGSKTFQLLEIVYQSTEPGSLPAGMIIANDVDVQRCNLLIHQTKRMCTANLMVTNHEAQHFPSCHLNSNYLDTSKVQSVEEPGFNQLLFDRILCDVPCSGDGTLRKAPDIWRKWNAGMGNGVHRLQVLIAMRGLALLKVGGRMVYSTCSLNPVENEAVVAEVLRRCGRSVELLDVSTELPQLVHRPGLKEWKVRDKGLWLTSFKDVPQYRRGGIFPSMFPSGRSYGEEKTASDGLQETMGPLDNHEMESTTGLENGCESSVIIESNNDIEPLENPATTNGVSNEEISCLPLERCMRILPHDQNSGAFFIAVLHKLSPLPASAGTSTIKNRRLPKKVSDEIMVDANGSKMNPSQVGEDHQKIEPASDANLLDDEQSVGDVLEPNSCMINEDNEPKEAQEQGDGEPGLEKAKERKGRLQIQGKWKGVDPVVFLEDEATINSIKEFYGFGDSFPFDGHLVTRNSDTSHMKRIYYISKSVQNILKLNFQVGQQLKITSIGLKMFERQTSVEGTSSKCSFRISSEGLPLLLPHITKQILCASLTDFKHLLKYRTIKFKDFVDAEFGDKASKLMLGCFVVVLKNEEGKATSDRIEVDDSTIAIGCWKGRTNVSVMVAAIDSQELLERLSARFGDKNGSVVQENEPSVEEADAGGSS